MEDQLGTPAYVNHGPDEVLLHIFQLLVGLADRKDAYFQSWVLLAVSRVCRRWHSIVNSSPILWSDIPVYSLAQARFCIDRSRDVPVRVTIDHTLIKLKGELDGVSDEIVRLIPRLRALTFRNVELPKDMLRWMHKLVDPAPLLESLSLELDANGHLYDIPIFGSSFPALRSLTLRNVRYPSDSPLFHNLLDLRLHTDLAQDPLGQTGILRILQRCPALEILVIAHASRNRCDTRWIEDEAGVDALDPISLPHLCAFKLHNVPVEFPHAILRHLVLPRTTTMQFETVCYDPTRHALALRLHRRAWERSPVLSGARSLRARIGTNSRDATGRRFTLFGSYRPEFDVDGPPVQLKVRHLHTHPMALVADPTPFLDVSAVERYELDVFYTGLEMASTWWRDALVDARALRTLTIRVSVSAGHVDRLLDGLIRRAGERGAEAMLCPSLERLVLDGAVWTAVLRESLLRLVKDRRAVEGSPFRSVQILTTKPVCMDGALLEIRALLEDFQIATRT